MKVRRIYRENYEASITPELVRKLLIVAAQTGFYKAQQKIRDDAVEAFRGTLTTKDAA